MFEKEINKYQALNKLAEKRGLVIFGGSEDREIPLCELKQAFDLKSKLYNRSIADLSVDTAPQIYDACVAELAPDQLFLHIGAADLASFKEDAAGFDQKYRQLIAQIKTADGDCEVAVISLKNPSKDALITEMNMHLKEIARSEQCQFCDIATDRVWNPKQTKEVVSFVYSVGFVRRLKQNRPLYDLVKILFS